MKADKRLVCYQETYIIITTKRNHSIIKTTIKYKKNKISKTKKDKKDHYVIRKRLVCVDSFLPRNIEDTNTHRTPSKKIVIANFKFSRTKHS